MERQPVSSTNIATVGYDADTSTLEVEFKSGRVYQYLDVPAAVFTELLTAPSVGTYLNEHVKNQYRYTRT